jgi:drug/metabolite transporter (DMT)-like permease
MNAKHQLEAIQSMLTAGHRSVHLETHTLMLWGLGGGAIVAFSEYVLTHEHFPSVTQRAFALLLWLGFWLGGIAWFDHRLTHASRVERGETLPFVQAQINRAWWMLLILGTLGSFAMFFFGGGTMIYAMWTVLLGLGIYLFGLFSRPLIEWIGLATLLLGVAGLAAGVPFQATHWLAASCFAVGLPLAGLMSRRFADRAVFRRALALLIWLCLVCVPALLLFKWEGGRPVPEAPHIGVADLAAMVSDQPVVLELPAGTVVPMKVDMTSPLLAMDVNAPMEIRLTRPLQVLLDKGQPEGRYRVGEGDWHGIRDGVLQLRISAITPQIETGKPTVRITSSLELNGD